MNGITRSFTAIMLCVIGAGCSGLETSSAGGDRPRQPVPNHDGLRDQESGHECQDVDSQHGHSQDQNRCDDCESEEGAPPKVPAGPRPGRIQALDGADDQMQVPQADGRPQTETPGPAPPTQEPEDRCPGHAHAERPCQGSMDKSLSLVQS